MFLFLKNVIDKKRKSIILKWLIMCQNLSTYSFNWYKIRYGKPCHETQHFTVFTNYTEFLGFEKLLFQKYFFLYFRSFVALSR